MLQFFLDFLFPRHSLTGREGEWITEEERCRLVSIPVVLEEAQLRGIGVQHLDRVVAASDYRSAPLLRKAIHSLKYGKVRDLHVDLAEVLAAASAHLDLRDFLTVCPVPLHWTRRFARGFNQAELLGRAFARERGWPFASLLRRVRPTGSQVGRGREERMTAVADAFGVRKGVALARSVLLIDDLSTTGATLDGCARALKQAGVARVQGLVVAHG